MSSPASTLVYRAQIFVSLDSFGNPSQFQIIHYPTQLTKAQIRLEKRGRPVNKIITMKYTRDSLGNLHDVDVTSNAPLPSDADLTKMITGHYAEQVKQTSFYSLSARPPYYDRNPKDIFFSAVNLNAGGAGPNTRWSYTVPAGRKAIIEWAVAEVMRFTAAGPAAEAYATIDYQVAGTGSAYNLYLAEVISNNVGDKDIESSGLGPVLLAGDYLTALDADASTGGETAATLICKIMEFDA